MLPSCLHAQVAVKPFYDAMLRDTPVFYEWWSLMAHTMAREGKNSHATGSAWMVHFSYGFPRILSADKSHMATAGSNISIKMIKTVQPHSAGIFIVNLCQPPFFWGQQNHQPGPWRSSNPSTLAIPSSQGFSKDLGPWHPRADIYG